MLTGLPPFYCRDREKLFEKIRNAELTFPKFVSPPARSVLTGRAGEEEGGREGEEEGGREGGGEGGVQCFSTLTAV
jgi:hypothetical protein